MITALECRMELVALMQLEVMCAKVVSAKIVYVARPTPRQMEHPALKTPIAKATIAILSRTWLLVFAGPVSKLAHVIKLNFFKSI